MSGFKKIVGIFFLAGLTSFFVPNIFTNPENSIDFFCVDLKYNHGVLKILEFQDGPQAGLRAYDEVFGNKGAVWHRFWDWLTQFNVPIWYIGILPHDVQDGQFSHYDKDRLEFDYFLKNIGRYVENLAYLERDSEFKKICNKPAQKKALLQGCKGILLVKDDMSHVMIKKFAKKYPDFIFINQYSRHHSNSKFLTDQLFQDQELKQFRPYAQCFPKEYTPTLARDIINEFQADYYMIKPVNSSRSNGVIMAKKEDLDNVLKKVLVEKKNHKARYNFSHRPSKTITYDYWLGDNNSTFIVEKYEPSQYISVNNKLYDPTMRAVCVMYNNNGKIVAEVLEAFWKIPPQAISDNGDLTEMHVSKYRSDLGQLTKEDLTVKPDDMVTLRNLLSSVMSKIYMKILRAGA